jgi:ATP-dependent Clp protease adaptor protein ClpS
LRFINIESFVVECLDNLPPVSLTAENTLQHIRSGMGNQLEKSTDKKLGNQDQTLEDSPCRVIIHNDDVTPIDFVTYILMRPEAADVTLTAHHNGNALVQVINRNEALKRVRSARFAAGLEGYPLTFSIEDS